MLAAPTSTDLAQFTGRPPATFGAYATEALAQATLMFRIVTKLTAYPDDPDLAQLAKYAIMELADRLLLEQPFAEILVRPYQSETIGSYTYSRATATVAKVQSGMKTGLFWWDLAVEELTVAGATLVGFGSIKADITELKAGADGAVHIVNPADDDDNDNVPYVRIS